MVKPRRRASKKPPAAKPVSRPSKKKGRLKRMASEESYSDNSESDEEDLADLVEETESDKPPQKAARKPAGKRQAKEISEDDFIVEDDEVRPR